MREAGSLASWLAASLFVLTTLPALRWVSGVSGYFELRLVPALLSFAPVAVVAFSLALRQRRRPYDNLAWLLTLLEVGLLQLFCASLVAWSGSRGAAAISSLFLFAAAYHGYLFRATLNHPWVPALTVAATVGAALLNPTADRIAILFLVGLAALTAELILGGNARNWARARHQTERLRSALQAQMLLDQASKVERLSDTVVELLGRNHDLGNAVMALHLTADLLDLECNRRRSIDAEIPALARKLKDGIVGLGQYIDEMKASYRKDGAPAAERVEVLPLLELVCASVRARFPSIRQRLNAGQRSPSSVSLRGGVLTLHRVIENLMLNACEGDGTQTASAVEVSLSRDPSGGFVRIVVSDDGPGFRPDELERPIEGFRTRKQQGTGLGLYTSERLVQASGGSLERANRLEGGAVVTVVLPLDAEPAAEVALTSS